MKKYEGYIVNSENEWATLTDEDIAKYPKRYEMETMYCPSDDITIIWAVEILCMPDKEIDISRQMISYVYGSVTDVGNLKFAQDRFNDFVDYNILDTKHNLLFSTED